MVVQFVPKITSRAYDRRFLPWWEKGITLGMGMTEKQGGTDVRANHHASRRRSGERRTASPGTSGSCRRRCATRSWCCAQAPGGLTVFLHAALPAGRLRERRCGCSASRTSSATAPTHRPKSSSSTPMRVAGRRGRARRAHHHRRWCSCTRLDCVDRVRRHDARGAGAGAASRAAPHRVRQAARRAADDAQRAGRSWRWRSRARSRW